MTASTRVRPVLSLLSAEQLAALHDASLAVLAHTGIRVDSERARRMLADAGAAVREDRAFIPRDLVDWAIRVSPATVDVFDRRGERVFTLGADRARFGVGVTNLYYQEPLTDEIVPFAREHMRRGVRLSGALPSYDVVSTLGVLRDLPPASADLFAVLEMVANTTKPLVILISDERLFAPALDMVESACGELGRRPFLIPYLNPITPLAVNEGTSDKLFESVARGLPVIFSSYGMAGMSTPITPAGALTMLNAELLTGLVLSQLAREGAPIILGVLPTYFDMKTMVDFYDTQTFLINLACAELMAHYRIPHAGTSASGEGWGPDLLAAGNMWINHVTSAISKVGLLPFCGSSLNSKAWSPALTVYGNDVIGQARLFAEGFAVDAAAIGVGEIVEAMATERHFLTTPTTLERYRNAYFEGIFPHLSLERWEELGHPKADQVLRERARELLEEAEPPPDYEEIVARGEAFIAKKLA